MEMWELAVTILLAVAVLLALLVQIRREREALTARLRALTRWHPLAYRREGRSRRRSVSRSESAGSLDQVENVNPARP
jgi:hypothetical protein